MKIVTATLIVLCSLVCLETTAQNQDNFEALISTLQDKDSQEIIYTVQVGAFLKQPAQGHFDRLENLFSRSYDDGFTRFFTKLHTSLSDAVAYRDSVRLQGYQDAFVLGLDGGFDRILIEVD